MKFALPKNFRDRYTSTVKITTEPPEFYETRHSSNKD